MNALGAAPLQTDPVAAGVIKRVRRGWAPPPDLSVSEFCDKELVVTTGPLAGSHWQTDFAPYQRGILNVFSEPGVEYAVVRGSSQFGKTSIAVGITAYHMAHDPCPILIVEPTLDPMAKDFASNRLDPVIAASRILNETVSKKRAKDSSNTTLAKTFRGGSVSVGGANSAPSLAARSIRLLILDEVDRYPIELQGEGSTISIALKRTAAFRGRRRVMLLSSPTIKGAAIDDWFKRGDQRRYYVPCPGCGEMHPFEWQNLRWGKMAAGVGADPDAPPVEPIADPYSARLHCPSCDYAIDDGERVSILSQGEWVAEATNTADPSIASFHIWEAYSPFSSLPEIVKSFLAARKAQKAGDEAEMHTWQNTTLGEPVEPRMGDGADSHELLRRMERYPHQVPAGACALTIGIDVQDQRLEALVVGWGPGEEAWLVDRPRIDGDTSQPGPWIALDEVLERKYGHATGHRLPIITSCIDSAGHRTTEVYQYALKQLRRGKRGVHAIIGRDGKRPIVSSPSPRTFGKEARPVDLWTIGVDAAKSLLTSRMKLSDPGPGYVHIPHADWADEELALQLTSERLVTKLSKGIRFQVWQQMRARNEMLDCFVYALAALRLARVDLPSWAERLKSTAVEEVQVAALDAPTAPRPPVRQPRTQSWRRPQ